MLLDFHHRNLAMIPKTRGKHRLRLKSKPQSPIHLKPRKLMPIAHFQLPISLNYDFTKTNDCLWTGVVGCLIPSFTRNQTSELKNQDFLPIHIRLGKTTFFLS